MRLPPLSGFFVSSWPCHSTMPILPTWLSIARSCSPSSRKSSPLVAAASPDPPHRCSAGHPAARRSHDGVGEVVDQGGPEPPVLPEQRHLRPAPRHELDEV